MKNTNKNSRTFSKAKSTSASKTSLSHGALMLAERMNSYADDESKIRYGCRLFMSGTSAKTTLDVYSHITTDMRKKAAQAIDKGIGQSETGIDESAVPRPEQHDRKPFIPKEAKCRKPGTGGVYMINDHLYEGRFTPRLANGKRKAYNIYARTREECEKLLAEMIAAVKAKIAAEKAAMN